MEKLYVITRADLPLGLQHAQIVHAALKFTHEHREIETAWYFGSNNIAILEVADQSALCGLIESLKVAGFSYSAFQEIDLNDDFTAVAVEPRARRLLRHLSSAAAPLRAKRKGTQGSLSVATDHSTGIAG